MDRNVRFWLVMFTLVLLVGTVLSPVTSANPPEGGDWTLAANGCWYRGSFWKMPGPSFDVGSCEAGGCPSHRVYYDPAFGYYEYWCPSELEVAAPPAPATDTVQPMPLVVVPAPVIAPPVQQCSLPPTVPFAYDTPWGTFVTFDNWTRHFYRYHDRCPVEADIWDFWSTQGVSAAGLVNVCKGCVLVDP